MPYDKLQDLPQSVKDSLPKHAQEIYKEAFNNAYKEYATSEDRDNPNESREELAHKVAWAAVKKSYKKDSSGRWVGKD